MKDVSSLLELGKKIKTLRQKQNISQEQLAQRCEFDRTYISMLERGKRNPSFLNLQKLCIGLQVNLSILLEDI